MQDTMAHNTQLTQESWGLTSALQYDVSNVFIHLGLDYQQFQLYQPYEQHQPPEQENNDDDEEDPDEGEQDSDEEDGASSKLGGSHRQVSHRTRSFYAVAMLKKQK